MSSGCSHAKNILRIYEGDICKKVKNIEAETKKHNSIKKKFFFYFFFFFFFFSTGISGFSF